MFGLGIGVYRLRRYPDYTRSEKLGLVSFNGYGMACNFRNQ